MGDEKTTPAVPAYDNVLLARLGEVTLKGLNRHKFEQQIIHNLARRLKTIGTFTIVQSQSRIWIEAVDNASDLAAVQEQAADIFGIVSVSPVRRFASGMAELERQAIAYVGELLADGRPLSFKVETRRGDKHFPLNSPQISERLGGRLLEAYPGRLTVKVHDPDFILYVEVRDRIYLYSQIIKAQKGLPVGTSGRGLLLLSGGIDSPVAGYMMASRGMVLEAVYFHAFPFTSDRAKEKVIELARLLTRFAGHIRLHVVHFTDIQLTLRDHCPPEMMTIVMRRLMMRIADQLATQRHCKALITGESLGQVASQTLEALITTNSVVSKPVFRPLIGMDKDDTVQVARRIGTFETSILPYEDCCTVFVARHPRTHPSMEDALAAETGLDLDALVAQGLAAIEAIYL